MNNTFKSIRKRTESCWTWQLPRTSDGQVLWKHPISISKLDQEFGKIEREIHILESIANIESDHPDWKQ